MRFSCASGQHVILCSSGDTTNAYPWLPKGCVIKQGNFCHNLRPCKAFFVTSKSIFKYYKNQFHFFCSLQRNTIQCLRKFLFPVLSWILPWWQLLHLAHNCSRTKHNSPDLSWISSEWSSHVWGLLCWDFWRKWRHCTLYRQVLRLQLPSDTFLVVESLLCCSSVSTETLHSKIQGLLFLSCWYVSVWLIAW